MNSILIDIDRASSVLVKQLDGHANSVQVSSAGIWADTYKLLTKEAFKVSAKRVLILVKESSENIAILNKILLLFKKIPLDTQVYIGVDYIKHDKYKAYKVTGLIEDVLVHLDEGKIKSLLNGVSVETIANEFNERESLSVPKNGDDKIFLIAPLAWSPKFPQLGLAYIYSSLEEAGHTVDMVDCNVDFFLNSKLSPQILNTYKSMPKWTDTEDFYNDTFLVSKPYIDELCQKIKNNNYKVVGISVHCSSELFTHELLKAIKKMDPGIKTIVGGPSTHPPFLAQAMACDSLDLAIKGEGEFAVIEAIKYLLGDDQANLNGCIINENGKPKICTDLPLGKMKDLAYPDFSAFSIYNYESFILPTSLSRGCVAKCTFCFETQYWKKFRIKRPENALHEIMHLADRYKIRNFSINDSLMNGSHKLLLEFCESVIAKKFDIRFYGYCRVDKKLSQNILDKMALAGCYSISFGVESGSRKILNLMDKGVKKEFILPTLRRAHKANINVVCCFMVGYPGESLWDYLETAILIWRSRKVIETMNLAIFQPSHETHMMENPEKYNLVSTVENGWVSREFWNSPFMQKWKYQLIRRFWKRYKKQKTSPGGWDYSIEK